MGTATLRNRLATAIAAIVVLVVSVVLGNVAAVAAKTAKRPSSCEQSVGGLLGSKPEYEPKELTGPLEAPILASFAVFRRAAQPSDQLPALNSAGNDLDSQLAGYYPSYVRRLITLPDGTRYFVIPAFERTLSVPPARCLPPSLRTDRSKLVEEQRKRASTPVYCIVRSGAGESSGAECQSFADLDEGQRVFASGLAQGSTVDIVPDGVASVRVVYRTASPVLASVSENAFLFTPPQGLIRHAERVFKKFFSELEPGSPAKAKHLSKARERRLEKAVAKHIKQAFDEVEPARIEWLAANGALVRDINPPSGSGGRLVISTSSRQLSRLIAGTPK